jgi:protein-tyrosine kinase
MRIIEQAAKRLEELQRAGVQVPWTAVGFSEEELTTLEKTSAQHQGLLTTSIVEPQNIDSDLRAPSRQWGVPQAQLTPENLEATTPQHFVELDLRDLMRQGYAVPDAPRSTLVDQFRNIKRPLLNHARDQQNQLSHEKTQGHLQGSKSIFSGLVPNDRPEDAFKSTAWASQNDLIPLLGTPGTKQQNRMPVRQRSNLVMVTSAIPGEGKTFCALNLALSIASEVDTSVLLVDSDVVHPSLLARLGLKGNLEYKGLLELLEDRSFNLSEAVLGTNLTKLSVLPAGRPRAHSTELLASDAMEALLNQLSQQDSYRIVIFDTPPLLATTESQVLATRMGQILMVVDENHSKPDDVAKAFAMLEPCPVVMSVLNKSRLQNEVFRYGYGYDKN